MLLFPQDTVNGRSTCCLLGPSVRSHLALPTLLHSSVLLFANKHFYWQFLILFDYIWMGFLMASFFSRPSSSSPIPIRIPWPHFIQRIWSWNRLLYSPTLRWLAGWMAGSIPIKKRAVFVDSVVCNSINVSHKMRWPCSFRRYFHCELMSTTKYALLLSCWIEENFMSN